MDGVYKQAIASDEGSSYFPSGPIGQPPQLVQPAFGSLDGQHRHRHAVRPKASQLRLHCIILAHPPSLPMLFIISSWGCYDLCPLHLPAAEHWKRGRRRSRRGPHTPDWQHIPPDPGRRWWMTGGFERRCLPPPGSPGLCWPSHLYR